MTPALSTAIGTVLRLSGANTASGTPKTAQEGAALCTRAAHIAHHEGRDATIWQPQLAVAAWAFAASDQMWFANTLALAVGVERALAPLLSPPTSQTHRPDQRVLGTLLGWFDNAPVPPDATRLQMIALGFDNLVETDHFAILNRAITGSEWDVAADSLSTLASDADNVIDPWHPDIRPGYEPAPTAIVAIALSRGMPKTSLSDTALRTYWPAVESRPGLSLEFLQLG